MDALVFGSSYTATGDSLFLIQAYSKAALTTRRGPMIDQI
jgi:hypothetical protein